MRKILLASLLSLSALSPVMAQVAAPGIPSAGTGNLQGNADEGTSPERSQQRAEQGGGVPTARTGRNQTSQDSSRPAAPTLGTPSAGTGNQQGNTSGENPAVRVPGGPVAPNTGSAIR